MGNLWKSGTLKAYYGYVAQLGIGVIGGIILGLMKPNALEMMAGQGSGYLIMTIVLAILTVAAYVYFFMGIKEMKTAAVGTSLELATSRLYIGAILGICGNVLSAIPLISILSILGAIVSLVGFIFVWLGYDAMKKGAANEAAKLGGAKLSTTALLSVISAVVVFIPVIGWIAAAVINVIAIKFAYDGWKLVAESELA
jgi:hypothetical protein